MDILVFGVILFIIALSATLLYDRYKENKVKVDAFVKSKVDSLKTPAAPTRTPARRTSTIQDANQQFIDDILKRTERISLPKTPPIRQKKTLQSKQRLTAAEMIAKLEEMKKK